MNEYNEEEHAYKRVWPDDPNRQETRLDQAIAIGMKVMEITPDNTRERARLALCLFTRGSYEYWVIDACMNKINVLKGEHGDNEKDPKIKDQIADLRKLAGDTSMLMLHDHKTALRQFTAYLAAMPMDRVPFDYIWKIHFQLANFEEALHYLNQVLDEDLVTEKARADYMKIRKEIMDYLVEREINKDAPKPGAEKLRSDALKAQKPPE